MTAEERRDAAIAAVLEIGACVYGSDPLAHPDQPHQIVAYRLRIGQTDPAQADALCTADHRSGDHRPRLGRLDSRLPDLLLGHRTVSADPQPRSVGLRAASQPVERPTRHLTSRAAS